MTRKEAREKYGEANRGGYVCCYNCPLDPENGGECYSGCNGMGEAWTRIAEYMTAKDEKVDNKVNHPNHYNNGGMECIDEMILVFGKGAVMNFCLCNAWKYRYRANAKNGQEDLDKANWYIAKYKELKEELEHEED